MEEMRLFKSILFAFLPIFLILLFIGKVSAAVPQVSPRPVDVNSYEIFWPVVAGKVQGDSLYSLKLLKEQVRGLFIISDSKKAEYFSFLSTKRLVEFEKLVLVKKDYDNAARTLKAYEENLKKGVNVETFNNQLSLLEVVLVKVDDLQKPLVQKAILILNSQLEKLR